MSSAILWIVCAHLIKLQNSTRVWQNKLLKIVCSISSRPEQSDDRNGADLVQNKSAVFLHVVHEFKRYFLRDFELPGYGSRGYFTCFLGPEYLENIFSLSLIKTTHQRKLRQTDSISIFEWSHLQNLENFGRLVFWAVLSLKNWKSKHLVCLKFSLVSSIYEGMKENIFPKFRA